MVDFNLLLAFLGFAFVTSITPGPNNLMVMASGAAFGWRRTVPHMAGIAVGFAVMLFVVVLGLDSLLGRVPALFHLVRIVGCAWLFWLAWQLAAPALRGMADSGADTAPSPGRPMRLYEAALFQWVNPKAWAMATGAAGAYVELAATPLDRGFVMATVFLIAAPLCTGSWLLAGEGLRRLTDVGKRGRYFSLAMALLLASSALLILFG